MNEKSTPPMNYAVLLTDIKQRIHAAATFVPQPAALFSSDGLLMEKLKDGDTRHWNIQATLINCWSRNALLMQLETSHTSAMARSPVILPGVLADTSTEC